MKDATKPLNEDEIAAMVKALEKNNIQCMPRIKTNGGEKRNTKWGKKKAQKK